MLRLLAAAALSALPALVHAATAYDCRMSRLDRGNWISTVIFIGHDRAAERVVVSDEIVLSYGAREPVEGRVLRETDARIFFVWDIAVRDDFGTYVPRMQYRARIDKATGRVRVTAQPLGLQALYEARGQCRVSEIDASGAMPHGN